MLTSAAPLPLGNSDPVQPGSKPAATRMDGGGAAETKSKTAPVAPPSEAAKSARLRDNETSETTERENPRDLPALDSPTGPPPAFRETPLERAGRLILNPDVPDRTPETTTEDVEKAAIAPDVPPTPTQRAETDFSLQQSLNSGPTKPSVEVTI